MPQPLLGTVLFQSHSGAGQEYNYVSATRKRSAQPTTAADSNRFSEQRREMKKENELQDETLSDGIKQQLEEYVDMQLMGSESRREGGDMYVDLETAQNYEEPVNLKTPSSDLSYL